MNRPTQIFLLVVALLGIVRAHPTGLDLCLTDDHFYPHHGGSAQIQNGLTHDGQTFEYRVLAFPRKGEVVIEAVGNVPFKGFYVKPTKGKFLEGPGYKALDCGDATHSENTPKNSVTLKYESGIGKGTTDLKVLIVPNHALWMSFEKTIVSAQIF